MVAILISVATLQVKGIDERLYRALQKKAEMQNRSVSQTVITLIQNYLFNSEPAQAERATERFLEICKGWNDDRSAETIISELKKSQVKRGRGRGHVFD